jgi:uncharacterized protein (TIRG00374 family)
MSYLHSMKNYLKYIVGVGKITLGLLLLWLSLRGVQWEQLAVALRQVSLSLLLATFLSVLLGLILKVIRWRILLQYFGLPVPGLNVFEALLAGQAANIILPARGGEVVRLGFLATDQVGQSPQILASIAVEKVLDITALAVSGLLVAAYLPPQNTTWIRTWLLPGSAFALILLVLLVVWGPALYARLRRLTPSELPRWLIWIDEQILSLTRSLHQLRKLRRILPLLAMTLLIWLVMAATNQILLVSLNLEGGALVSTLVLVLIHIGLMPALMPGNIGPFYFFVQLGLTPFAISSNQGLAFAMLLHALITLPPLILGGLLFLRSGRSTLLLRNSTS